MNNNTIANFLYNIRCCEGDKARLDDNITDSDNIKIKQLIYTKSSSSLENGILDLLYFDNRKDKNENRTL